MTELNAAESILLESVHFRQAGSVGKGTGYQGDLSQCLGSSWKEKSKSLAKILGHTVPCVTLTNVT